MFVKLSNRIYQQNIYLQNIFKIRKFICRTTHLEIYFIQIRIFNPYLLHIFLLVRIVLINIPFIVTYCFLTFSASTLRLFSSDCFLFSLDVMLVFIFSTLGQSLEKIKTIDGLFKVKAWRKLKLLMHSLRWNIVNVLISIAIIHSLHCHFLNDPLVLEKTVTSWAGNGTSSSSFSKL